MENNSDSTDVQRNTVQTKRTIDQVNLGYCDTTTTTTTTTTVQEPLDREPQNRDDEEQRLDDELQILRKMRLSFASALHMLEVARDDLNRRIPRDVEELRRASERIRAALAKLREHID
jgi:hypothetical protein